MPIRALIIDDSPTFRALARDVLARAPEVEVVGEAADGVRGVQMAVALRPDVIVMDVHLPGIDGFEATRRIMDIAPTPVVIVSNMPDQAAVVASLEAIDAGALVAMPKPGGPGDPGFHASCRQLVRTVIAMAGVRVVRRRRREEPAIIGGRAPAAKSVLGRRDAVAIAASTGGPSALRTILGALPGDLRVPIFVVQHISEGFVHGLARWLDASSELEVLVAEHGAAIEPGHVYIAPSEQHLEIEGDVLRVRLSHDPPREGFRPSASTLFESIARAYDQRALGVVLTGMGRDGSDGLRALRQMGGRVIAQDEATSVVFGMPGAAIRDGLADVVIGLPEIASVIVKACS